MAREEIVIVAGVGCRRGAPAEDVLGAVDLALADAGLERTRLDAIATAAFKADEPGVRTTAASLAVPLLRCVSEDLERVSDRTLTTSARVKAATGVTSIAEAAALVAAGRAARLLGARVTNRTATCAIAVGEGS